MYKQIKLLKKALELISNPNNWCQGAFARNNKCYIFTEGFPVPPWSFDACKWSFAGALEKVSMGSGDFTLWAEVLCKVEKYNNINIIKFNDTHTHQEIIDLFKKTIAKIEK